MTAGRTHRVRRSARRLTTRSRPARLAAEQGRVGGPEERARPSASSPRRDATPAEIVSGTTSAVDRLGRLRPATAARIRSARATAPVAIGRRGDDDELLAAVAGDDVAGRGRRSAIARATRRRTASPTAWPWSLLTSVNRSRSRTIRLRSRPAPGGAGERGLDRLVEVASVEQPGQRVADGGLAHAGVEVGVVQRDLDLGDEQVGDAQLELGERPVGALAGRGQDRARVARRGGSAARARRGRRRAVPDDPFAMSRGPSPPRPSPGATTAPIRSDGGADDLLDPEGAVGAAARELDRVGVEQVARRIDDRRDDPRRGPGRRRAPRLTSRTRSMAWRRWRRSSSRRAERSGAGDRAREHLGERDVGRA